MYMSKKYTVFYLSICLFALCLLFYYLGSVSDLYLAGQQDAVREEWIRSNAEVSHKYAYLTFDDGPSDNTDKILDILKQEKVKATFFVVGQQGQRAKKRYLRIVKEGHTLGMHSYTHDYDLIYRSVSDFANDINKLDKLLFDITGIHPTAFRFPGGSSNSIAGDIKPYIQWVKEKGLQYYDWNAVSGDALSFQVSAQTLNQNILKDVNGQENIIILMHDLSETVHTTQALPNLIKELKNRGYELRKITEDTVPIQHVTL